MKLPRTDSPWTPLNLAISFCMILTILFHSCFALIASKEGVVQTTELFFPLANAVSWLGVFPFCLPALMGMGLRIQWREGVKDLSWKGVFQNVGLLLFMGCLWNFLCLGPPRILQWNLLMFLGLSYWVLFACLRWGQGWLIPVLGAFTWILSTPMIEILGDSSFAIPWVGSAGGISLWPIFPWFSVVVFGFVLGQFWLKAEDSQMFLSAVGSLGAILVLFCFSRGSFSLGLDPANLWGRALFHPHGEFFLALFGTVLLLLYLGEVVSDRMLFENGGWMETFTASILWVYLTLSVLGVWGGHWLQRPSIKIFWSGSVFPPLLVVVSAVLGVQIQRILSRSTAKSVG